MCRSPSFERSPMAVKKFNDGISVSTESKVVVDNETTVRITLPLVEEGDGLKVDQTEQVVINGKMTNIRRGIPVDVKVPVFMLLKQRYPLI